MLHLIWARSAEKFTDPFAELFGADMEHWRGITEDDLHIWLIPADSVDAAVLADQVEHSGLNDCQIRTLADRRDWVTGVLQPAPVANFVLREVNADSLQTLLPALHSQIEAVADRPGCEGCSLYAEANAPHHLLGITYWQSEQDFRQYALWAGKHPWKDTITPVTLDVPIRLLTKRVT